MTKLLEKLKSVSIILGSQSPRRKELLASMGIDFEVEVRATEEYVNPNYSPEDVAWTIAAEKLRQFESAEYRDKLVIVADTIVVDSRGSVIGKPANESEAVAILERLSGKKHTVLTAVGLLYKGRKKMFNDMTEVYFNKLSSEEIRYYVTQFNPVDKAGAYGIQEWLGRIGVSRIHGTYENVMGLPTSQLYHELKKIFAEKR